VCARARVRVCARACPRLQMNSSSQVWLLLFTVCGPANMFPLYPLQPRSRACASFPLHSFLESSGWRARPIALPRTEKMKGWKQTSLSVAGKSLAVFLTGVRQSLGSLGPALELVGPPPWGLGLGWVPPRTALADLVSSCARTQRTKY
jgi:hypothetical protein